MSTASTPRKSESSKIQVFCRVRPKLRRETAVSYNATVVNTYENNNTLLEIQANNMGGVKNHKNASRYVLDHVFPPGSKQEDVYTKLKPTISSCFKGINCTVYCYGQTGTGKTHTMLGIDMWGIAAAELLTSKYYNDGDTSNHRMKNKKNRTFDNRTKWGIIPNTATMVFNTLEKMKQDKEINTYTVSCTYLELYNERIYDLLSEDNHGDNNFKNNNNSSKNDDDSSPRNRKKGLSIREDKVKGVFVPGASDIVVDDEEQILSLLWEGARNRAVSATDMNEYSSRSHTIFQIIIEIETASTNNGNGGESGPRVIRRSKINLVDLAGSETMKENKIASLNQKRISELTSINQSLSCLGNCVRALSQSNRTHVPYRDSKLTRLLQDSLGGNTKTTFIVTISPDSSALSESISTLQFADRAKQVKVNIVANETFVAADALKHAESEIKRLKGLLTTKVKIEKSQELKKKMQNVMKNNDYRDEAREARNDTIENLKRTVHQLQNQLSNAHKDNIIHRHPKEHIAPLIKKIRKQFVANAQNRSYSKTHEVNWLATYTKWLKTLPTVSNVDKKSRSSNHNTDKKKGALNSENIDRNKLTINERVQLMEWSTLLQMQELEKAKASFVHETEKLTQQIALMKLKELGSKAKRRHDYDSTESTNNEDDDVPLNTSGRRSPIENNYIQVWNDEENIAGEHIEVVDDAAQNNYRNQANNGLIYDTRNYNSFDENSEDEIDEEDRDEEYSVGKNSNSNDESEDYETYDNYEKEQEYSNQQEHSKINIDVSKELDVFMSNIVRTPTNSPLSRENDDKSPQRTRDLTVTVEDSTNEFIMDEAMSPSRIWHKVYDPNTGQYYYFNEKTKETQWHEPTSPSIEIRSMSPFEDEQ
jgi:hypothetical protein